MGAPLAVAMKKSILIIRKSKENNHGDKVEGWNYAQKILLLDDFTESGATLRAMRREIKKHCPDHTIVGTYLYAKHRMKFYPE
jgi:hypoxanthine phosphoribosyltransferase